MRLVGSPVHYNLLGGGGAFSFALLCSVVLCCSTTIISSNESFLISMGHRLKFNTNSKSCIYIFTHPRVIILYRAGVNHSTVDI